MARRDDMGTHQTMARHDHSERHSLSHSSPTRGRPPDPLRRDDLTGDRHGLDRCANRTPLIHVSSIPQPPVSAIGCTTSPPYRWLPLTQALDKNETGHQENLVSKSSEAISRGEATGEGYMTSSTEPPCQGRLHHMSLEVSSTRSRTRSKSTTSLQQNGIGRSRSTTSIKRSALFSTIVSNKTHTQSSELAFRTKTSDTNASDATTTPGFSCLSDNITRSDKSPPIPSLSSTQSQPQKSPMEVRIWATDQSDQALASPGSLRRRSHTVHKALTTADYAFPVVERRNSKIRGRKSPIAKASDHCNQHGALQSSSCPVEPTVDSQPGHGNQDRRQQRGILSGSASFGAIGFPLNNPYHPGSSNVRDKRKGSDPPDDRPTKAPIRKGKKANPPKVFNCVYCSATNRSDVSDDCKTKKAYVSQLRRHHQIHGFYYCTTCFQTFSREALRDAHGQTSACAFKCVTEGCPKYRQVFTASNERCEHGKFNSQRNQWRELFRLARPGEDVPDPLLDTADGSTQHPQMSRRASAMSFARNTPQLRLPSFSNQAAYQSSTSRRVATDMGDQGKGQSQIQKLAGMGREIVAIAENLAQNEDSLDSNNRKTLELLSQYVLVTLGQLQRVRDSVQMTLEAQAITSSASTNDAPAYAAPFNHEPLGRSEPTQTYDTALSFPQQPFNAIGSHYGSGNTTSEHAASGNPSEASGTSPLQNVPTMSFGLTATASYQPDMPPAPQQSQWPAFVFQQMGDNENVQQMEDNGNVQRQMNDNGNVWNLPPHWPQ